MNKHIFIKNSKSITLEWRIFTYFHVFAWRIENQQCCLFKVIKVIFSIWLCIDILLLNLRDLTLMSCIQLGSWFNKSVIGRRQWHVQVRQTYQHRPLTTISHCEVKYISFASFERIAVTYDAINEELCDISLNQPIIESSSRHPTLCQLITRQAYSFLNVSYTHRTYRMPHTIFA